MRPLSKSPSDNCGWQGVFSAHLDNPETGCPFEPSSACNLAAKANVAIKLDADATKRKFQWKWKEGTTELTQANFGDPVSASPLYRFCLYDSVGGTPTFAMGGQVAAGGTCGEKPCWKALGDKGWAYKNKTGNDDGITQQQMKGGVAGKPQNKLAGKGANLPLSAPVSGTTYFAQDGPVTVQLFSTQPADCWTSSFSPGGTSKNTATQFKAKAP